MSFKLDLGKMKYLKSDDKSTTLQHPAGHTVTLAHNVLSKPNQDMLKALGKVANSKKMAYGGISDDTGSKVPAPNGTGNEDDVKLRQKGVEEGVEKSGSGKIPAESPLKTGDWSHLWKAEGGQISQMPTMYDEGGKVAMPSTASEPSKPEPIKKNEVDSAGGWSGALSNLAHPWAEGGKINYSNYKNPDLAKKGHEQIKAKAPSEEQRKESKEFFNKADYELKKIGHPGPATIEVPRKKLAQGGHPGHAEHAAYQEERDESMASYDAGLPCLNPHCKSHGKPHPNCRCYSGGENFAEGGEVSKLRYCAHGKPHKDDCEYAAGGSVHDALHSGNDGMNERGISEQGADVRHANKQPTQRGHSAYMRNAKAEQQGRHKLEQTIKPKMKGLAEGGGPEDAPDIPEKESFLDTERKLRGDAVAADHYAEAARLREKAGDSVSGGNGASTPQSMPNAQSPSGQPQQGPPNVVGQYAPPAPGAQPNFNSVTGQPNFNSVTGQTDDQQPDTDTSDQQSAQLTQAQQPQQPTPQPAPQPGSHPSMSLRQPGQSPQQHAQDVFNKMNQEAMSVAQDYGNGHITPKTYADLFAQKSTLGKVAGIFGMLLSGAGSGLAHQPNMALEMMNKQIDMDLEAQKATKAGQTNFLNTAHNFLTAQSNIALQGKEGKLLDMQTQGASINNQILEQNLAKTNMMLGMVHNIYGLTSNMPPGPPKAAADQAANYVANAVKQKIVQNNAQTAQVVSNNAAKIPTEQEYNQLTQQWRGAATLGMPEANDQVKYREEHMIPGVGVASKPITGADSDRVLKINNFQNLLKEAKSLAESQRVGPLTPAQKARSLQIENDLISSYNDVKGLNRFTSNEENLYKGVVPNLSSNFAALTGARKASLDRLISSVQQKKDLEYKQLGITPFEQQQSSSPMSKSGKPIHFVNGKWEYKK